MKQSLRTNRLFCALSLSLSFLLTGCSFLTGDKQFNSAENGQNETNKLSSNPQIKQESPEYWRAATLSKEDVAQSYGPLFVSLSDDFVYGIVFGNAKDPDDFPTTGALVDQAKRQKWDAWQTAFFDSLCSTWKLIGKIPGQQTIHLTILPNKKYAITYLGRVFPGVLHQQNADNKPAIECSIQTLQKFNEAVEHCIKTAVTTAPSLPAKEFSASITFGADRERFPRYQPARFHFIANTNIERTTLLLLFERKGQQSYPFTWAIRAERAKMFGTDKFSASYSTKQLELLSYDNAQQSRFALDWRPTAEKKCPTLKVEVDKTGRVLDAEVTVSSGDSRIDQNALTKIRTIYFSPLPDWYSDEKHVICFDLKRNWRRQHPADQSQSVVSDQSIKLQHDSKLSNFLKTGDTKSNLQMIREWIDVGTKNYNAIGSRSAGLESPSYETLDLSIKTLHKIISKAPDSAEAYYLRGVAELQLLQPKTAEALNDFDRSIKLNNRNGLAHWFRGIIYLSQNGDAERTQKSVAEFDQAITNGVTDAIVYTDRGIAYDILGDSDAAMQDYDEALRKEPGLAMARRARMRAHYKLAQDELALQDCEALQKICENPSNKEVFATLSGESIGIFDSGELIHTILLIRLRRYDEALAKLNKETEAAKGLLKGQKLFLRGLVYAGQGRKGMANVAFQQAEQLGYNASNFAKQN